MSDVAFRSVAPRSLALVYARPSGWVVDFRSRIPSSLDGCRFVVAYSLAFPRGADLYRACPGFADLGSALLRQSPSRILRRGRSA